MTTDGATDIHWSAAWDDTLLGRVVHRRLTVFYPEMVRQLAEAASAGGDDRRVMGGLPRPPSPTDHGVPTAGFEPATQV